MIIIGDEYTNDVWVYYEGTNDDYEHGWYWLKGSKNNTAFSTSVSPSSVLPNYPAGR